MVLSHKKKGENEKVESLADGEDALNYLQPVKHRPLTEVVAEVSQKGPDVCIHLKFSETGHVWYISDGTW
jgi:hypothetical protein